MSPKLQQNLGAVCFNCNQCDYTFSKKGKFSEEGKGVTSVATKPRCGVETLATTIQASLVRERERGGSGQKATKMSKRKK